MISFCDGMRHLYLKKLNEVSFGAAFGINDWLCIGNNFFINQNQSQNDFTLCTYDALDILYPYAFDINRLSCASFESIRDIERKKWQPKFIGWNITKLYYSAFFSTHCILKITGNSLSNIDSIALNKIRQITKGYGFSYQNLNAGLYSLQLNTTTNIFRFYKNSSYDDSHEGLWRCFLDFLNNNQNSIYSQLPTIEAQRFVDKINELVTALTNWGCVNGNWLSRFRNKVNYSQSFGTWFPYKEYLEEYDGMYDCLKLHLENPLQIDLSAYQGKQLLYFVKTCQLINAISYDMLRDLQINHPTNKSFVINGINKFQKLYPVV